MTHLFEFFAFGEIGYFAVAGIIALMLLFIDIEHDASAFWSTALMGTLIWLSWSGLHQLTFKELVTMGVGYIGVGVLYSAFKWFIRIREIIANNSELLKSHGILTLDKLKEAQNKYGTDYHSKLYSITQEIDPSSNKRLFYGWIILWPWNFTWTLTHNFFDVIFESVKSQYKNIVNHLLQRNLESK